MTDLTQQLNKVFTKIIQQIPIYPIYLVPLNIVEERENFLSKPKQNPKFIYRDRESVALSARYIHELEREVEQSAPKEFVDYFLNLINYLVAHNTAYSVVGSEEFTEKYNQIFGYPTTPDKLAEFETIFVDTELKEIPVMLDASAIAYRFKLAIEKYALHSSWTIDLSSKRPDSVRVMPQAHKIYIGENILRTSSDVDRLVVHEIETHVLRSLNGENQSLQLLKFTGLRDYVLVEEGLAVYMELANSLLDKKTNLKYLLRAKLASNIERSFVEIYESLRDLGLGEDEAFESTFRVKRGLSDTSLPGGCQRDSAYCSGYFAVKQWLNNGGSVEFLYSGKVSLHEYLFWLNHQIDDSRISLPNFLKDLS